MSLSPEQYSQAQGFVSIVHDGDPALEFTDPTLCGAHLAGQLDFAARICPIDRATATSDLTALAVLEAQAERLSRAAVAASGEEVPEDAIATAVSLAHTYRTAVGAARDAYRAGLYADPVLSALLARDPPQIG